MTILYDLADPAELSFTVRELPEPAGIGLNAILPDRLVTSVKAVWNEVTRTNRAAMFRSWDAESPIGERDSASRKEAPMYPISQKTVIGELESILSSALAMSGNPGPLIDAEINNDLRLNANAVRIRAEIARGDVLTDGVLTVDENGFKASWDYGVPDANTATAAATWATTSTDVTVDFAAWMTIWRAAGGDERPIMTLSMTGYGYLLQNEKFRALAASGGVTPPRLTLDQVNDITLAHGWPEIRIYDSSFNVAGSTARVLHQDIALITPRNPLDLGFTAWGITAEALELAQAQRLSFEDAPGLVAVVMKTEDPVATWTKVGGTVLPVLTNPSRLMALDITT
jgi:hypothetical protein